MKKILSIIMLSLVLLLVGCTTTSEVACGEGTIKKDGQCVVKVIEDVVDEVSPVLSGVVDTEISYGSTFDKKLDITATDDIDGDITSRISVAGYIDVNTAGVYTLTYTVSDAAGNVTTETRDVTVGEETINANGWIGYSMDIAVEGDVTTVTYPATPEVWWESTARYAIGDFDETKESLQFTFTGELDHLYLFKVEGPDFATEIGAIGTGAEQVLIVPLNQFTEAQRDSINLLIVFVKTVGAEGSIALNLWSYSDAELPSWNVYGEIELTENESSVLLDYSNTPTNWWESNAQQVLDSFDGTHSSIVFTFTGELDHDYLFKIEGNGAFTEASVTATGELQEFILPLNTLSETQRNGLNLIVWFCQTSGASGSIEITGWDYVTE